MQENNNNKQKQGGLSWSTPAQGQTNMQKQFTAPKTPPIVLSEKNPSTKKYIGMIALGIIAGIVIAWGWSSLRSPANESVSMVDTDKTSSTSANMDLGVNTSVVSSMESGSGITIVSPQTAGNSVAITGAVVTSPTWIVIYEDNNGKPGNALGAALFFAERQSGTVELLRATTAGKSYLAVGQVDNGDRKFSLKEDQFLTSNGEVQWVTFDVK